MRWCVGRRLFAAPLCLKGVRRPRRITKIIESHKRICFTVSAFEIRDIKECRLAAFLQGSPGKAGMGIAAF
jgi:hypothetical protein